MPPPAPDKVPLAGQGAALAAVALAAVLLVVQQPWALTHAQLSGEDGSVHLVDVDAHGWGALLIAYRGYLHTLPRLVALAARAVADVSAWPTLYNGLSYAIAVVVLLRIASPRLEVPAKPAFILAVVCAANTGEVFLNATNLHWLTALVLVVASSLKAPRSRLSEAIDLALVVLVGLTGPFSIVFLPLFVARWIRERGGYAARLLVTVLVCAAVQAFEVLSSARNLSEVRGGFHGERALVALGTRLAAWPLLGPQGVRALGDLGCALTGAAVAALAVAVCLAKGPGRPQRLFIGAAFLLITAACLYRLRPDTWAWVDLESGDSYFFIPRVLLAWLLLGAWDGRAAWVRWGVGAALGLGIVLNLYSFVVAAPADLDWVRACDPIRRGEAADIPTLPEGWVVHYPGRPAYVRVAQGWSALETDGRRAWRWSAGRASLRVGLGGTGPGMLHVWLRGRVPTPLEITLDGHLIRTVALSTALSELDLPVAPRRGGECLVEMRALTAPVPESADKAARALSFALYRVWVEPEQPAR